MKSLIFLLGKNNFYSFLLLRRALTGSRRKGAQQRNLSASKQLISLFSKHLLYVDRTILYAMHGKLRAQKYIFSPQ